MPPRYSPDSRFDGHSSLSECQDRMMGEKNLRADAALDKHLLAKNSVLRQRGGAQLFDVS